MDDFDDLTRTVSARRSAAQPSSAERPAPPATPDVYEARQVASAAAERSARSTQTFSSTLSILAVGALIGFLAGFWLFRPRLKPTKKAEGPARAGPSIIRNLSDQ